MNILAIQEYEDDDSLSLSDLPLHDYHLQEAGKIDDSIINGDQNNYNITNFEFSTSTNSSISSSESINDQDDIVFCGKIIPTSPKIISAPEPEKFYYTLEVIHPTENTNGKNSNRFMLKNKKKKDEKATNKRMTPGSVVSGNPRNKHRVLIGLPVKIPTKMKLSDIKERQMRHALTQMFPAGDGQKGNTNRGVIRKPRLPVCGGLALAKASFSCLIPRMRKPCVRN